MALVQDERRPSISVIVPCLGQAGELEGCLRGLQGQGTDIPYEILVVDSACDALVAAAAVKFPGVRLIRSGNRLSAGAARNLGVKNANADWLAFIDADCIPGRFWIRAAYASLGAGHLICGGPVLDLHPNHPIAWADNRLQFADFQAGRPRGLARYLPGANMVLLRSIFAGLGGFLEDPAAGEDTLMTSRAHRQLPTGMHFNPDLVVRHRGRDRWRNMLEHQWQLGYRRSNSRLHMDRSYVVLARHPSLAGLVILRRLAYIGLRTLQFDPPGLIRLVLFSPWLLAGLIAWTAGFYRGAVESAGLLE